MNSCSWSTWTRMFTETMMMRSVENRSSIKATRLAAQQTTKETKVLVVKHL